MKTLALAAALAAAAVPAFAQSARVTAIEHFNMFADTAAEELVLNDVGTSGQATGALSTAIDVFNGSQDTRAEQRGLTGVTVVSGTPEHGADIFARLRAAAAENE